MPAPLKSTFQMLAFVATLFMSGALEALNFTLTSSNVFYFDTNVNPPLDSMYFSYDITNNLGPDYSDLWITAGAFGPGCVGLAPNELGRFHVGNLATGQTKPAFFYFKTSCATATPQTYSLTAYPSIPPSIPITSQSFSITSSENTNQSNSNKVEIVFSGPNPPAIGGIVAMTVTGTTGIIGATNILAFSPAAYSTWKANYFTLVGTSITVAAPNSATHLDRLQLPTFVTSSAGCEYVAVYSFRVAGSTTETTRVSPIAFISSGSIVKHTDTGNYAGANFQPVSGTINALTLSQTASPAAAVIPGPVNYTLRLENSGVNDAVLDSFRQTLPSSPGTPAYVSGSSTFNGIAIPDPVLNGQILVWGGVFNVPAVSYRDLRFQLSFPCIMGTYSDSCVAYAGITQIDTTLNTSDNSPSSSSVLMGGCTYTPTPTASPSATATSTPTPLSTNTISPTSTQTPTATPSSSPTATETTTPTVTETDSPTATETATPTATQTDSPTATETITPTATQTDSPTATETITPTVTPTDSPTATETITPTATETSTETSTPTDSPSATPSSTSTPLDTATATPTVSETYTVSPTFTASPSRTPMILGSFAELRTRGSGLLGPNPRHPGETLCHEPLESGGSHQWVIYGVDKTRLFEIDFGSDPRPCWKVNGLAPGIYFVRITTQRPNETKSSLHKLMVIP